MSLIFAFQTNNTIIHDINKKALTKLLSAKGLQALVFDMYSYRVG